MIAGAVAGVGGWRTAPGSVGYRWHPRLRKPGSLPYPNLPMGTDTVPQIKHIVVAMMENHSYDNRLGMLHRHGADGFQLGRNGLPVATNPTPTGTCSTPSACPPPASFPAGPARNGRPATSSSRTGVTTAS